MFKINREPIHFPAGKLRVVILMTFDLLKQTDNLHAVEKEKIYIHNFHNLTHPLLQNYVTLNPNND